MKKENRKFVPEISTQLKADTIIVPKVINNASGIRFYGKRIKSLIFTTDIAIIMNNNADAVFAVYPFTPHPSIFSAITSISQAPVFAGVGGGTTGGKRCAQMGLFAESHGCIALVLNAPTTNETLKELRETVDGPIVFTIVSEHMDIKTRLNLGVNILNISGGKNTSHIVKKVRKDFPDIPIIATGGKTDESIQETIDAGANAITYTPPTNGQIFRSKMEKHRKRVETEFESYHKLV